VDDAPALWSISTFDIAGYAMSTNVHLTPELERFARECVAEGRYNNVSEVVRSGLRLLQELEEQRRQFTAMLDETLEEADREGCFTVEEVRAGAQAIIDAHKR
jgi:antitoxin ParD1/3/4